jgi:hypothetical protein
LPPNSAVRLASRTAAAGSIDGLELVLPMAYGDGFVVGGEGNKDGGVLEVVRARLLAVAGVLDTGGFGLA